MAYLNIVLIVLFVFTENNEAVHDDDTNTNKSLLSIPPVPG